MTTALAEGTIDLLSTETWICDEHQIRVKAGHDCAFCAVELNGPSVLY